MRCWVSVLSVVRFVLRKMIMNLLMFISLKQKTMSMCVKIVKKIVGFVIFVQRAVHVSDLLMSLLICGYQKMKLYGFAKTLLIRFMNSVVSVVGIVLKVYFQKMAYALTVKKKQKKMKIELIMVRSNV